MNESRALSDESPHKNIRLIKHKMRCSAFQIAGHQRRTSFIALAENFEEHFGPGLGPWHEAEFIHNQQLLFGQMLLIPYQALLIPRFDQLMYQ
jgi:hypothetical protein